MKAVGFIVWRENDNAPMIVAKDSEGNLGLLGHSEKVADMFKTREEARGWIRVSQKARRHFEKEDWFYEFRYRIIEVRAK